MSANHEGNASSLNLHSDEIRRREKSSRRQAPVWNICSFVLHIVLFIVIVFCTPVKRLVFEEKKEVRDAAKDLSADRIEEIAENLTEAQVNAIAQELEALQAVLHNMDVMKREIAKDYDAFAAAKAPDVKEEIKKALDEVEKNQKDSEEAQKPIRVKVAELIQLEKRDLTQDENMKKLRERMDSMAEKELHDVSSAQSNAASILDRVQVQAEFAGLKKTEAASQKMRDAQIEAAKMQSDAQNAGIDVAQRSINKAYEEREVKKAQEQLAQHEKPLQKAQEAKEALEKKLAEAKTEKEKVQADQKAKREELKNADAAIAQVRKSKDRDAMKAAQAKRDDVNRQFKDLIPVLHDREQKERDVRKELSQAEREVREHTWPVNNAKKRLEEHLPKLEAAKANLKEAEKVRQQENLEHAAAAQKVVSARLDDLRKILQNDEPEPEKLEKPERKENELVQESFSQLGLVDAYEKAKELEQAVTESYKDLKATQMAIQRKMSFKAAQAITDVAKSDRLVADKAAIEEKARTKEALDRKKQAQKEVVRETQSITENAVKLMEEAMKIVEPDAKEGPHQKRESKSIPWLEDKDFANRQSAEAQKERLEAMNEQAEYQIAVRNAAAEDENEKAKDVSQLMAKNQVTDENSNDDGRHGDGKDRIAEPPPLKSGEKDIFPGNVLHLGETKDAVGSKWMFINSWYVIGPFPNPGRINLRRKFPPESVVDLDASYPGDGGKMVKWKYMQAQNSRTHWGYDMRAEVIPDGAVPYTIWYGYTEVFVDRDCDLWLAIGSDDRSDVWVNDVLIWGSSNELKSWNIAEGYRKVHFKKGRNRLLLRCENGWHSLGWSVSISLTGEK